MYLGCCLLPPGENTLCSPAAKSKGLQEFPTVFNNLHENREAVSWSGLVGCCHRPGRGTAALFGITKPFPRLAFYLTFPPQNKHEPERWRPGFTDIHSVVAKHARWRNEHFVVLQNQWKTTFKPRLLTEVKGCSLQSQIRSAHSRWVCETWQWVRRCSHLMQRMWSHVCALKHEGKNKNKTTTTFSSGGNKTKECKLTLSKISSSLLATLQSLTFLLITF